MAEIISFKENKKIRLKLELKETNGHIKRAENLIIKALRAEKHKQHYQAGRLFVKLERKKKLLENEIKKI